MEKDITQLACEASTILSEVSQKQKIAIYPYGKVGRTLEDELRKKGVQVELLVDNGTNDSSNKVIPFSEVDDPKQYVWAIATVSRVLYSDIKAQLIDMGCSKENVFDVCKLEEEFNEIIAAYDELEKTYERRIDEIRASGRKQLRFGVYLMYAAEFTVHGLIKKMSLIPKQWTFKIVVVPDRGRGDQFKREHYERTKQFVVETVGSEYMLDGYDFEKDKAIDHSELFDIVYCDNCYDAAAEHVHSIEYLSGKTLPIFISYGYDAAHYYNLFRLCNKELNYVWKYFIDTQYALDDCKKYQLIKGRNTVLCGYSKMDRLYDFQNEYNHRTDKKKSILIAPHHTVDNKDLPLSNFLKYAEYFKNLPKKYPDVQFIFRPHPVLFVTLINLGIWTEEEVKKYLEELNDNGIVYSYEGDYLRLFAECDAMINDCGSFTIEWLYTGKPGCFMLNENLKPKQLTKIMIKAISAHDIARSEEDIDRFIQKILDDDYEVSVPNWVKDEVMINYPDVSSKILEEIDILK